MSRLLLPASALAAGLLTQCQHVDPIPAPTPSPLELLPPATQTGARTFGCLVNGQAWTPAGQVFAGPLFTASYLNGHLGLSASRTLVVNATNDFQRIGFSIANLNAVGTYALQDTSRVGHYEKGYTGCELSTSTTQSGTVTITKLDKVNRIVSGTFTFMVEQPSCGKFIITAGRFDAPY